MLKYSLNLGRVFGIKLQVHWTFLLLIGWLVFSGIDRGDTTIAILWNICFVLSIFACVVLHELGHSLTARRYGISTRKITLLPIGGLAGLERIPEEPKKELLVAVAGPAVNVVIAALLWIVVPVENFMGQGPGALSRVNSNNFLFLLLSANVVLVIFNAIPAFPMDGGRVLRALLAMKMNRVKATQIASGLGQLLALGFFFFGLLYNPFLVLIAIFVYFGARSESMMVQNMALLRGYQVQDAMMTSFTSLSPHDTLDEVVNKMLAGPDNDLVVEQNEQVLGVVTRAHLLKVLKEAENRQIPVSAFMEKDFEAVNENSNLTDLYNYSQRKRKSFFPVLKNHQLAGVINIDKINEFLLIRSSLQY